MGFKRISVSYLLCLDTIFTLVRYDFEGGLPSGYPADVDRFHVDVNVSKRDMAEYYLKPMKACVVEVGPPVSPPCVVTHPCTSHTPHALADAGRRTRCHVRLSLSERSSELRRWRVPKRLAENCMGLQRLYRQRCWGC